MTRTPTPVKIESKKSSFWSAPSLVWIIPILALVITLGIAWQAFERRGPLIEISFENGTGVAAGKTELRYRDVTVGKVEKVEFAKRLDSVVLSVRLHKDVAPYVDSGAKFWVVSPQVTAQGISGLDTVISGVFIEGSWDEIIGESSKSFVGLDEMPLIRPGERGLQLTLRSGRGTALTDNASILFRGIEVGRIGRARIVPNGDFAISEAVIYDDFRHLISDKTRFWDVSGFEFNVGAGGAEIQFQSLTSLVSGGLTFDTIVSGGRVVQDGHVFQVFSNESEARASVFSGPDAKALEMTVVFSDNVAGLKNGAVVEWNGLKVGEVTNIAGVVDSEKYGDENVRLNATIAIQPARLGLETDTTTEGALALLQHQVSEGLRARLASASLLTGGLKIELIVDETAPPAEVDMSGDPFPIFPSTQSQISDVAASAEGVFTRINNLPIEDLLSSAIDLMDSANAFFTDDALRGAPEDLRGLIGDARGLVGSPEAKRVPVQLNEALERFDGLLAELEEQQAIAKLADALEAAADAAGGVDTAIAGVPDLIERLEAVTAKAEALEVEALVSSANEVLDAAAGLIASDATAELPASLSAALSEIRETLKELREGGAVTNTNEALASARDAADAVAVSTQELPALVERMNRVLSQASSTLQTYDASSDINRGAKDALRELQLAARAISDLARTIQRNPNSLLLGR
ncbi:intermembrane transport protein PqiB (plasmid) [Falsihalocynthiibacter sp. SS001]|uniref:PqiB family protein n=1 Tax=Falsihalocynthiibacter sp. SS001 TaxID=3349698 RepID=UPI0036D39548